MPGQGLQILSRCQSLDTCLGASLCSMVRRATQISSLLSDVCARGGLALWQE